MSRADGTSGVPHRSPAHTATPCRKRSDRAAGSTDGGVNTYHLWAATYHGDDLGVPYDDFYKIAGEHGVAFTWRSIQKPPCLHGVIREPASSGRVMPTAKTAGAARAS